MQGLSSFGAFVEEAVKTENPAPVFAGASFGNNAEKLWHSWPPVQFDTIGNEAAQCIMGHHVKEEKNEKGNS